MTLGRIGITILGVLTLIPLYADRLVLTDGTVIENCYLRDEGIRVRVWKQLEDVGTDRWVDYRRSQVKEFQIERGDEWDARPNLPDLSVIFIEMNPKLAGLHGRVQYDSYGRPKIAGGSLPDLGERAYTAPEEVVKGLKLRYTHGEEIRLTANVKNVGFTEAKPFEYVWLIDGREVQRGRFSQSLKVHERAQFELRWQWQDGLHTVTFRILTSQPEIATINNSATDPMWGFGFTFYVHPERVKAWHPYRNNYGTFAWEDFYRWHIDLMNLLFEHSVYPSAPEGIRARARLDRIVYLEDMDTVDQHRFAEDSLAYDQGVWIWRDEQDRNRKWEPPTKEWRNQTEWSLPHELGHQLGLTDLYALDYHGHENHTMPDNGDPITHYFRRYQTMMHWHGPHLWSEVCAGYLNQTWDKPRGHFGDYYFALPEENYLQILDVNGRGVPNATVEIFQRGVAVDTQIAPSEQEGVQYFPVVEDGNFEHPVSSHPVIRGKTDANGMLRLPNRPVKEVRTLNGYHRRPNPFGNLDVVGRRGLMLVRVTLNNRACHYWLEITDFNLAVLRGQTKRFIIPLKTPYGSVDSPPAPHSVRVERLDEHQVRLYWDAPALRDQHYLDKITGFRIYRRISSDGLNDRPWFPVATVDPETRSALIDLRQGTKELYWFSQVNRFAVSTISDSGVESELVEVVLREPPRE